MRKLKIRVCSNCKRNFGTEVIGECSLDDPEPIMYSHTLSCKDCKPPTTEEGKENTKRVVRTA